MILNKQMKRNLVLKLLKQLQAKKKILKPKKKKQKIFGLIMKMLNGKIISKD